MSKRTCTLNRCSAVYVYLRFSNAEDVACARPLKFENKSWMASWLAQSCHGQYYHIYGSTTRSTSSTTLSSGQLASPAQGATQ